MRVGADVEVFGLPSEEQIPDAAADKVRRILEVLQTIEHLQRVGIDVSARNCVL